MAQHPIFYGIESVCLYVLKKNHWGRMKATVTEPSAPAILMKSVKVFTIMQTTVVITIMRERRLTLLIRSIWSYESEETMVKRSMIVNAAKIWIG